MSINLCILNWIVQFQTVLRLCDGRKALFNNRTMDEGKKAEQVQQFLAHVTKIGERNLGKPFTDEMHRKIKVKMWLIHFSSASLYIIFVLLMFEFAGCQEEAERLREHQKKVEAKNLGEGELAEIKKQLQMSYEQQMSQMTKMVKFVFIQFRLNYDGQGLKRSGSLSGGEEAKRCFC